MSDLQLAETLSRRIPANTRLTGQKPPLKPREVWSIRIRLQLGKKKRDLALFNLAIDSKLRSCDLVTLQVADVAQGGQVRERAIVIQQKTGRPVQFELTEQTREAIRDWLPEKQLKDRDFLFPSRIHHCSQLSTRQYARHSAIRKSAKADINIEIIVALRQRIWL
ncbi:MAG TPA: hypothetical protein ENI98_03230 [Gammaproteobacteria bacterium]|nr:hypothetical protein [Gammaproteobacteria bacterium]